MFPEFLEFDGTRHRTARLNPAVALICQNDSKLKRKKRGKSIVFRLAPRCELAGTSAESPFGRFTAIKPAKDIPNQTDTICPKIY